MADPNWMHYTAYVPGAALSTGPPGMDAPHQKNQFFKNKFSFKPFLNASGDDGQKAKYKTN